jgi:hypothetical protein
MAPLVTRVQKNGKVSRAVFFGIRGEPQGHPAARHEIARELAPHHSSASDAATDSIVPGALPSRRLLTNMYARRLRFKA